ncbi:MAG: hypothetical protein AAB566_01965, partial [Patescibacteria group bacterium]
LEEQSQWEVAQLATDPQISTVSAPPPTTPITIKEMVSENLDGDEIAKMLEPHKWGTSKPEVILDKGEQLVVLLEQNLNTDKNQVGDHFQAVLYEDLGYTSGGGLLFPKNTRVSGQINELVKAGRTKGRARISLLLVEIGNTVLETYPLVIEADPSIKKDAGKIARDVSVGLLIGLLGGGKKGAAIGGGIGAGAGVTEVLLTRGRAVKLPAETKLVFYLAKPLIFTPYR